MEIFYFILGMMCLAFVYNLLEDFKVRKRLKSVIDELETFIKSKKDQL